MLFQIKTSTFRVTLRVRFFKKVMLNSKLHFHVKTAQRRKES